MSTSKQNSVKYPLCSICIVNFNGLKYLPAFFNNLKQQTYPNLEVVFIDQDSPDESVKYVQQHHPDIKLIRNKNSGYAGGSNLGMKYTKGKYYMIWTVDVNMESDFIRIAVDTFEKNPNLGVFGGKIYKYDFKNLEKTKIIDTVGELCTVSRRVLDDGQGIQDKGQFNKAQRVFGISGQNPIYRRTALENIKIEGDIWDETFFMYKEDVDVSWRLLLYGWEAFYEPKAIGYHIRGTHIEDRFSLIKEIKSRKKLSPFQKFYSLSNHSIMVIKNELGSTFALHFPFILSRLFGQYIFTLFTEPKLGYRTIVRFFKMLPKALHTRKIIMKHKRAKFKDLWPYLNRFKSIYLKSKK